MTSPNREKIIKIEEVEYDDYVYDLEVEDCHTFLANDIFVHNTDSEYFKSEKSPEEWNKLFYDFFNKWIVDFNPCNKYPLKNPYTGEVSEHDHAKLLEHEKTFDACIVVKKKRYYFKVDGKYETKGGAYLKTDTSDIAKEWQKKLTKDILDGTFDIKEWKQKLLELRKKVENFELEENEIIKRAAVSRELNDYGQPVIDGNSGEQKVRKSDGAPMFAPIPAHIQVAKRLQEQGVEIEVDDKIEFIVESLAGGKIVPVSLEEFRKNKMYSVEHYFERIISPILEILHVTHPTEVYSYLGECWGYNEKKLKRLVEKYTEEDEDES